jgi:hypothetical protein
MYKLKLSRRDKKKLFRLRWVFVAAAVLAAAGVIWLAWIRPIQQQANISSFEECVAAGNPVQESYPEVCLAKDGDRFVNVKQKEAREASLAQNKLAPPSNSALLKLDIEEWNVRVPLTMESFDLSYAYLDTGDDQVVHFSYKRLLELDACRGDIGLTLRRSFLKRNPPYTESNPAPIAQVDKAYFYPEYAAEPCYDPGNAEQAAVVKEIAGDKTLIQATADLLTKLTALPKQ